MSITIDMPAQEIAALKQLTQLDNDAEAVIQAAREFLRLSRLRELKAVSGKVEFALECGDLSPLLRDAIQSGDESPHSKTAPFFVRAIQSGDESPHSKTAPIQSGDESPYSKAWPHAPLHRLSEHGTYLVTAGTLYKEHCFGSPEALDMLESALLRWMKDSGWQLEAWAVFSNHYHFIAHGQPEASDLRQVLKQLHGETARDLNRLEHREGRQVWHNYWDTKLTYEKSYLARLNYVHQNAVKHGVVRVANQYRWCSAAWFERTATLAQVKTIYSFKTDKVKVFDDFEVLLSQKGR